MKSSKTKYWKPANKRPAVVAYALISVLESQKQVDTVVQDSLLSPYIMLFLLYFLPASILSYHMYASLLYHLDTFL